MVGKPDENSVISYEFALVIHRLDELLGAALPPRRIMAGNVAFHFSHLLRGNLQILGSKAWLHRCSREMAHDVSVFADANRLALHGNDGRAGAALTVHNCTGGAGTLGNS